MATRQRSIASTQNARCVLYTRLYTEWRGKRERERGRESNSDAPCSRIHTWGTVYARGLIKLRLHTYIHTYFLSCALSRMHPGTKANAAHVTERGARAVSTARKRSRVGRGSSSSRVRRRPSRFDWRKDRSRVRQDSPGCRNLRHGISIWRKSSRDVFGISRVE